MELVITITVTVACGIIVAIVQKYFIPDLRDRRSIKKTVTKTDEVGTMSDISIKTSGPLSMKTRPIYIYNSGVIKNIKIIEGENVVINRHGDSEATVLTTKGYNAPELHMMVEGSGVTTASGIDYNRPKGFDTYTSKAGNEYHFFIDRKNESAWAVKLVSPSLPGVGTGNIGPDIEARSEDDAREKLINTIESGDYIK